MGENMNCNNCLYRKYNNIIDFCYFNRNVFEEDALPNCYLLDRRYLLKYMCSGGNSNIYKAYDLQTNKMFAIKECYIRGCYYGRDYMTGLLIPEASNIKRLSKKVKLFIKEAEKLNELDYIEIFPKMYNIIKLDEYNIFYVMELLPQKNIFSAEIKNSQDILKLFKPLINGLKEMHHNNIIHRDLNINNLLLVNGKIKLIDLGIAKRINDDYMSTERLETTVSPYMPKEHQEHRLQDSRTDVFMLAQVIEETYKKLNISIPGKIQYILEKNLSESMQERDYIDNFYFKLYGKDKKSQLFLSITVLMLIFLGVLITDYCMHSMQIDVVQSGISNSQNEKVKDSDIVQEEMLNKIKARCKYDILEQYVVYADFDSDGKKEMFVFVPTEIDDSISDYEDERKWINYGEMWFCDGENTSLIDKIGMDDWQGASCIIQI